MTLAEGLILAQKVLELAAPLAGLGIVGRLAAPALRWLAVGRRAKTAQIVAQLAKEALVAAARKRGVQPSQLNDLAEAIAELEKRLIRAGIDPKKAGAIAADALAGAQAPGAAARDELLGG